MPKYLVQASYTPEGLKGLQKDKASGRADALRKAVESIGGKLEAYYVALGDYDVVTIIDAPDIGSITSLCLTASGSGLVRTKTTALLTVEETDRALQRQVDYRAPGR